MIPNIKPTTTFGTLPSHLQARLDSIIQAIPQFWEQKRYNHFTNQGPAHSERVQRLLAQLVQELPDENNLTSDEIFIVLAAAWLYEIGMQSPILKPVLDFEYTGGPFNQEQLGKIRKNKHLLSQQLILQSLGDEYKGPSVPLGLQRPIDKHTLLIAEVCRWCSDEPLDQVPESDMVNGISIRVRLLASLLRLADQLYIDSPRINLEILEGSNLPPKEFARWWAYHYTSVLPIGNGQIRFNYFLPSHQREFIGHIRALIEPEFEFDNNPVIQYIGVSFHLRLLPPGKPSISRLNTTPGFLRPMSDELTLFLRNKINPIPTEYEPSEPEEIEIPKDRCLLVLDFENFVQQLGQEGYFFTSNEVVQFAVKLSNQAAAEFKGKIKRIAIGHWQRPDLAQTAKTLEARAYDLESVTSSEKPVNKLINVLLLHTQEPIKPKRLILVAPSVELARTVEQLVDKRILVAVWVNEQPDVDIYRGSLGNEYRSLRTILQLVNPQQFSKENLESKEAFCILKIQEGIQILRKKKTGLSQEEIRTLLEQVDGISSMIDWWNFNLIQREILVPIQTGQESTYQINLQHPTVIRILEMRQAVIETMKELQMDSEGIAEDILLQKLREKHGPLFVQSTRITSFLESLKGVEILRRSKRGDSTYWILNPGENVDQYISKFILSLDHIIIREGFPGLYEHSLGHFITKDYLSEELLQPVYQKALENGLVQTREYDRTSRGEEKKTVLVTIDDAHPQVGIILRNRNILLNFLANNVGPEGLVRSELYDRLIKQRKVFTLSREEFDIWIEILLHDQIVSETKNEERNIHVIKLNQATPLTMRLFGRMYLCEVVRTMRRLRATKPDGACKETDVVEKLRFAANVHAQSAVDYAKQIKLIMAELKTVDGKSQTYLWLNRHSFIWRLDKREEEILPELSKLIRRNADRSGWVPKAMIYSKLDENLFFGYARQEQDYWIETALWRRVVQQEKLPERGWCLRVLEK